MHTSYTELHATKYSTFKYLVTEVVKWYDEKHEFSALLRLLDKKIAPIAGNTGT